MAQIHPSTPLHTPLSGGDYRERDILKLLEKSLPAGFDVFHSLTWAVMWDDAAHMGEMDLVVVSPGGHLLVLEVKAGKVSSQGGHLSKDYGQDGRKDIAQQIRRQHQGLLARLRKAKLSAVQADAMLVMPDDVVRSQVLSYPRERVIDASDMPEFCQRVMASFPTKVLAADVRQQVIDLLANRFAVQPDVSTHVGQVQRATKQLANGLATWVPQIRHEAQMYVIEATAGSGKTQLALTLLSQAARDGLRAAYVCFNRPLSDHVAALAPARAEVSTFHQLCREHADRVGLTPDFAQGDVFGQITQRYLDDAPGLAARFDLLVLDESQDLEAEWVQALAQQLKPGGRLYLMGDPSQQIYDREGLDLPGAVVVQSMDNFRSPRRVVEVINALGLSTQQVQTRSVYAGQTPHFKTYAPGQVNGMTALHACLAELWADGYTPAQVAVLSFKGIKNSEVLAQSRLCGHSTRRFAGQYDEAGNPIWTEGDLLVDSVYRFKGQSAPAVVLCEVDFETLSDKDKRKLFVGLTRGQMRVDVVLSDRAANALLGASA